MTQEEKLIQEARKYKSAFVATGTWLMTRDEIGAQQLDWPDDVPQRHMDFSSAPYWVVVDNDPFPIHGAEDLTKYL